MGCWIKADFKVRLPCSRRLRADLVHFLVIDRGQQPAVRFHTPARASRATMLTLCTIWTPTTPQAVPVRRARLLRIGRNGLARTARSSTSLPTITTISRTTFAPVETLLSTSVMCRASGDTQESHRTDLSASFSIGTCLVLMSGNVSYSCKRPHKRYASVR